MVKMTNLHTAGDLCSNKQMIYAELIPLCNRGKLDKDEVNKITAFIASDALKNLTSKTSKNISQVLIEVSKNGHLEIAKAIIASHSFKNIYPTDLRKILMESLKNGSLEIIKSLVTSNVFQHVHSFDLREFLIEASKNAHLEIVKILRACLKTIG